MTKGLEKTWHRPFVSQMYAVIIMLTFIAGENYENLEMIPGTRTRNPGQ